MKFRVKTEQERSRFIDFVRGVLLDGKVCYEGELKKYQRRRSIPQNKLLWLWLAAIAAETGNDRNDLHDYFKNRFLPKERKYFFGKETWVPISTTKLNTKQFSEYLDHINADMAQQGIVLCNPDDLMWDRFYEKYRDFVG